MLVLLVVMEVVIPPSLCVCVRMCACATDAVSEWNDRAIYPRALCITHLQQKKTKA